MSGKSQELADSESSSGHPTMPLYRKLLLTALLTGNDISVSFEQLYQVSLLQILGVPVTYVSFTPVVSGPLAMILVSLQGYLGDKGLYHKQRKVAMVVFNAFIILSGLIILIGANLMMMSEIATTDKNFKVIEDDSQTNTTSFTVLNSRQEGNRTMSLTEEGAPAAVSMTAILGLLGFCIVDVGYDMNIAATRSCILSCSSRQEHTPLLVMALVMAGAGGCITTLLGTLDLSAVLGLGDRLVSQTTLQLIICCFVVIITLISTAVTALLNSRHLDTFPYTCLKEEQAAEDGTLYGTFNNERETVLAGGHTPSQGFTDSDHSSQESNLSHQFLTQETSACRNETHNQDQQYDQKTHTVSQNHPSKQNGTSTKPDEKMIGSVAADLKQKQQKRLDKQKFNFIIACITAYLGSSVLYSYNLYAADFVGKVVMGGDSTAPRNSPELIAYENAVSVAASGLLVFFCCYMAVSIVHNRLLTFWGLKVDFCLSHGLMAMSIVCLTLSKQTAAFYVCCVLYGFHRASLLSVPFIIANDYVHEQTDCGQGGRTQVGRGMAVVTCMIPLNYTTVFLISGPLITLTHNDSAPLILASVSTFLAALIFLLYKS